MREKNHHFLPKYWGGERLPCLPKCGTSVNLLKMLFMFFSACYGIIQVPTGPWFCRKCESQERAARVVSLYLTILTVCSHVK